MLSLHSQAERNIQVSLNIPVRFYFESLEYNIARSTLTLLQHLLILGLFQFLSLALLNRWLHLNQHLVSIRQVEGDSLSNMCIFT